MPTGVRGSDEVKHRLAPLPQSLHEARRLAREAAGARMSRAQVGNLDLAVTETVSNAVRHSGAEQEIVLALTPKDDFLCVRVTDGGSGLVPSPGAIGSDPGAGFGLFLVEQVTRRWGMTREDGQTRVWFEIDFEAGAEA